MGSLTNQPAATRFASNPFSTKYICPGAIEFDFENGDDASILLASFQEAGFQAQVVGPHGSGKSTLLKTLGRRLKTTTDLRWIQIQPPQHRTPFSWLIWNAAGWEWPEKSRSPQRPIVWFVDGFDHLGWFIRRAIRRYCRRNHTGLLVTTHRDLNMPTLYQLDLSFSAFRKLVHGLMRRSALAIDETDFQCAYDRHFPNVREALFELYDRHEGRRRAHAAQETASPIGFQTLIEFA